MRNLRDKPSVCIACGKHFMARNDSKGLYCSRACSDPALYAAPEERFWKKVVKADDPDACWQWDGATHQYGYGRLLWNRKVMEAHVVSWLIHHGPIPEGFHVCHNCPGGDNPECCNPYHLFLGTNNDNRKDSVKKRTHYRKLTEEQVLYIRQQVASGRSQIDVAKELGKSGGHINNIVKRRLYDWVLP